ncbi:histone deacetylase 9-B isoform X4 [Pygocentrus nattereri]|uniref:histone deacetylase 9-B isoform X4 n=1 Tax=Pygocentrus nattereri TaxID=42514 RepID=UPI0008145BCE|nr:histone deacetylase 9-B isoform X4 [Pygocentrus nattereri]
MMDGKRRENYRAHKPLRRTQSQGPTIYAPVLLIRPVDVKPDVPLALEPVSPLDLRTDGRMLDPSVWERQLQQELLLIQKQQQIQKELLINEFQKQHENLLRQHQAQLQEHLKLQQELQAMKQRQEQLEKERKLEQQNQERELERNRRQQQALILRSKERARESAVASTEVKQKLQEFLLNKSTKESIPNGSCHALSHSSKLWLTASHHTSLEQSSPPLGGVSPSYRFPLPPLQDYRDDFPLRKTASEPNLKVRSRLKQKVAERRSSPLLRRKEGSVMTPFKKRALELLESSSSSSAPGSGPSSPNGASSALGTENGPSSLPTTTRTEAGLGLKEKHAEGGGVLGLPAHVLGHVPLPITMETKVGSSQQALLQHLLQKEQLRQQKILTTGPGAVSVHPPSPLATKDRCSSSVRPKLQRHRPLNRTQSAPLPQSMLAQLVIQQHQHFLEKQKQYQQQVHINKLLSKSIEQLRQPSGRLHESEEDDEAREQEDCSPSTGVIRKCSPSHSSSSSSSSSCEVIKIKEEPVDSDDDTQAKESSYLHQVNGRLVIRATI